MKVCLCGGLCLNAAEKSADVTLQEARTGNIVPLALAWDACGGNGHWIAERTTRELLDRGAAAVSDMDLRHSARVVGRSGSDSREILAQLVLCIEAVVARNFEYFHDEHFEQLEWLSQRV